MLKYKITTEKHNMHFMYEERNRQNENRTPNEERKKKQIGKHGRNQKIGKCSLPIYEDIQKTGLCPQLIHCSEMNFKWKK